MTVSGGRSRERGPVAVAFVAASSTDENQTIIPPSRLATTSAARPGQGGHRGGGVMRTPRSIPSSFLYGESLMEYTKRHLNDFTAHG